MGKQRHRSTGSTGRLRRLTVRVSYDADLDYLEVLRHGEATDGKREDEIDRPTEGFYLFRRGPNGRVIGFGVEDLQDFEVPGPEDPLAPRVRFDATGLALRNATAEHVILAAQATHADLSTPDVVFYDLAVHEGTEGDDEQAEIYWRACLAAGDPKAHFGLGYTLCDLGRPQEAYGHLLEYTRVVPRNGWAWTWLGQACEGIGEARQAARCYRHAIRLEDDGEGFETDAAERLERLQNRGGKVRRRRRLR